MAKHLILLLALFGASTAVSARDVTDTELQHIATLVFHNECASSDACLTSWNEGEEFASLGIGHFIWYPAHITPTFQESFPALLAFMQHHGATLPAWLANNSNQPNPWLNRQIFLAAYDSQKMQGLRSFLKHTKPLQAKFMQQRLRATLPTMLAGLDHISQQHVREQFEHVQASPMGMYALMDYVNFKGEGVNPNERYHGQGWGLLQVLEQMSADQSSPATMKAFADSADHVLTQRVALSPPSHNEKRWLPGWRKRLATYIHAGQKVTESCNE